MSDMFDWPGNGIGEIYDTHSSGHHSISDTEKRLSTFQLLISKHGTARKSILAGSGS